MQNVENCNVKFQKLECKIECRNKNNRKLKCKITDCIKKTEMQNAKTRIAKCRSRKTETRITKIVET